MYAQRRIGFDPYRGRDLTPDEAWTAEANPGVYRWIQWRNADEEAQS